MAAILPIPTTRTSDFLARTRLVQQIQSDQVDLLRLQNQLSTGRRIFVPSDDPGAALRAITLQRTLERKDQLQVNIGSSTDKLTVAEGALGEVSTVLNEVRSETLGVIDTVASDTERQAVKTKVEEAIESLLRFANSQYQDTFLFGGSRALQPPYVGNGNYVEYRGNEATLRANVELGQLFDTNIPGDEVFGGLSEPVRGSVDLNLQASEGTYLSQLNGGDGISPNGSVQLSIGLNVTVVDLSNAHTLGDVARAIEVGAKNVPGGEDVTVDVGGGGLIVNPGAVGLAIVEVSGGRTAQELGIRQPTQTTGAFGGDLNPVIRKTSDLSDLVGVKAVGRASLGPSNAGIKLVANDNGTAANDLDIDIQAGASEGLSYAGGPPPVLTVTIVEGVTTAADIAELINADTSVPFTASIDFNDADSAAQAGQGVAAVQTLVDVTAGGSGTSLDLSDGLRITNGDGEVVIDTSAAETVEDLLNILNQSEYGLSAAINDAGDGIDVRSRRSGADFTIGENGGTLAEDLGLRTFVGSTRIEDFNRGAGVATDDSYFLTLDHYDGSTATTEYRINLSDDAFGDFSGLAAPVPVTGSLDLTGSYRGASGNNLTISFAEDNGATTHSAALSGNNLTITVGTDGLANGATVDLDAILTSITDTDFTDNINYTPGDLVGDYTVSAGLAGGDNGQTVAFDGGGQSLTVDDVNSRIQAASAGAVGAGIATEGNGFELTFNDSSGQILRARGLVAERLGFFDGDAGEIEAISTDGELISGDRNTQEVDSVFNTLLRLRTALEDNDTIAISDAYDKMEGDLNRATFARSELGSRVRSLEVIRFRAEDEEVQLRSTLSEAIDADYAEVISDFTARQFALQASLQTSASLLQLTVLNFL